MPELKLVNPQSLIPANKNARTHSEVQIKQIAASIQEFGFTNPVLTDGKNGIIAGHGRVLAAIGMGIEKVPILPLKNLTPKQIRAYIIADNKLALNAGWDENLLKEELYDLKSLDFDLELTGFNDEEIAALLGNQAELPDSTEDDDEDDEKADSIPSIKDNVHEVNDGDVFTLGDHTLHCGDNIRTLASLEPDSIDSIVSDPPAGISFMAKD